MAVSTLTGYRWSGGAAKHYVCDTEAELPASGLTAGRDTAYTINTKKSWVAASTTQWETQTVSGSIPAGLIAMWHGTLANIPTGWVLCDGQNGTPDLRDKFVKGAASGQNPGATGGNLTHSHANHASHTHDYTQVLNHTHTVNVTDPGHTHVITSQTATSGSAGSYEHGTFDTTSTEAEASEVTATGTTGITATTANPAGGVATGTTAGPSATLTHDSPNHEPPYYAVAYIMKT